MTSLTSSELALLLPRTPSWRAITRQAGWSSPNPWRVGEVRSLDGIFTLAETQAGFPPPELRRIEGAIRFYATGGLEKIYHRPDLPTPPSRLRTGEGYILYDVSSPPDSLSPIGTIIDTAVLERYRRRGLGRFLVDLMESRMTQYEVDQISGHALQGSEAFWRALNYTLEGPNLSKKKG